MKSVKFVLTFVFVYSIVLLNAGVPAEVIEIEIDVAPNVLNIASEGTVVTVHTNIAYSLVNGASVTLNGVEIAWWKSDSRGQFVAKFDMLEVEKLVDTEVLDLGDITLELKGNTWAGDSFSGSQTIRVVDITPAGEAKK